MLCNAPKIERNLYQIQLLDQSGRVIKTNLTESPFQDPEILPSNRVGRWEGESKLETYYELDYNQSNGDGLKCLKLLSECKYFGFQYKFIKKDSTFTQTFVFKIKENGYEED